MTQLALIHSTDCPEEATYTRFLTDRHIQVWFELSVIAKYGFGKDTQSYAVIPLTQVHIAYIRGADVRRSVSEVATSHGYQCHLFVIFISGGDGIAAHLGHSSLHVIHLHFVGGQLSYVV